MPDQAKDPFEQRLKALLPPDEGPDVRAPLVLAYVGDAVFELAVRTYLATHSTAPVRALHRQAAEQVRASAQAQDLADIEHLLTDEEQDVVRRARNTKANVPKSASIYEYRYSTAFEALLGHLFLTGQLQRLVQLLELVIIKGETHE